MCIKIEGDELTSGDIDSVLDISKEKPPQILLQMLLKCKRHVRTCTYPVNVSVPVNHYIIIITFQILGGGTSWEGGHEYPLKPY